MGRKATDPANENSRIAELPGGPTHYRNLSDAGGGGTSVSCARAVRENPS